MDRFKKYVSEMFTWNEAMKNFLEGENVGDDSELWVKLNDFTDLMENLAEPLNDRDLLNLQARAETIQEELEGYFSRKQSLDKSLMVNSAVPPGGHVLPKLSYAYDALEPVISGQIMRLHHQQHHLAYVEGLNNAELNLKKARETNDYSLVKHWSRELAFHGSGHYLHTLFWKIMSPHGGGAPGGRLLKEIEAYFGSFPAFKKHFTEAAKQVEGNGWALLVWSPRSRRLEILQSEKHMQLTQWDTIPLLVIDVWEHAYYLQYENKRAAYVDNWWKIVNWSEVERRFEQASELKWLSY